MIKIELTKPFNLNDTVTCGQIFRFFKQDDGSFDIILKDRVINVFKVDNYLYVSSNNEEDLENIVKNYFDLDNDYGSINDFLMCCDKKLENAIEFSSGLTMIKQDPFITIIEYIISANNGVNQIANSLNLISKNYGKKIIFNDKNFCYDEW